MPSVPSLVALPTQVARAWRQLRGTGVIPASLLLLTCPVIVVAALTGPPLVLASALAANYALDEVAYRGDQAARWLQRMQFADSARALFRQTFAVLGWVVLTRPDGWLVVLVTAAWAAHHGVHAAYRLVSARNLRQRQGRIRWVNLEVGGLREGPSMLPPTLPRVLGIGGPRLVLLSDVLLMVGLAVAGATDSWTPLVLGLLVFAAALGFAGFRVLQRHRLIQRLPRPEDENTLLRSAVRRLSPTVVVYFSGGPGTTYQLNVWLETLSRLHQPALIMLREGLHLDDMLPNDIATLVLPRAQDVEAFALPSMLVALYPTTVVKNNHLIRVAALRHVFINHGDGDKAVTYSPLHRVFDEIWVAGQAACDRYLTRGEGVRPDQLVRVGRPQLAHIRLAAGSAERNRPLTVLYAPTWEGNFDNVDYSSVARMGEAIVGEIMAMGEHARLLVKPHPATGTRLPAARAARDRIEARLRGSSDRHVLVGAGPEALYDAFNQADVLIADISSVVADFLASRKPYIVTNPRGVPLETFQAEFPSTGGGHILQDVSQLREMLQDAAGSDRLRARREELATYFLGEPVADPVARFAAEVDRACARSRARRARRDPSVEAVA